MTIEIGSQKVGRVGRRGRTSAATSMPIGEVDANIFGCPACRVVSSRVQPGTPALRTAAAAYE